MAATSYTYSIQTDFPRSVIASDRLSDEIRKSAIVTALDRVDTNGDSCLVWFKGELSTDDQTILSGIIGAHSGEPYPAAARQVQMGLPVTSKVSYESIKKVLGTLPSYFIPQAGNGYNVFSVAEKLIILTELLGTATADIADFETNHKAACTEVASIEDAFLLGTLSNNIPLVEKRNSDGLVLSSAEPRVGTELTKVSPNFCKKTTWWYDSGRAENETLTDSGDGLTFNSPHEFWIDNMSGSGIFFDPYIALTHDLSISVTVDGNPAVLIDPLYPTDPGDYTVNFEAGTITFKTSKAGSVVAATYSYAQSSVWALVPAPGMDIDIESVEAQFSEDTIIRDTVVFELWAYDPNDLPNKMLYGATQYRSMRNFVDEALGSYPVVPAIGGDEGRGLPSAIYGFPFRYGTMRRLTSATGLELRIRLLRDIPFGGSHCTATFYCTIRG